jgi:hypothetical protein
MMAELLGRSLVEKPAIILQDSEDLTLRNVVIRLRPTIANGAKRNYSGEAL